VRTAPGNTRLDSGADNNGRHRRVCRQATADRPGAKCVRVRVRAVLMRNTSLGRDRFSVAGVAGGSWVQNRPGRLLAPIEYRDPTGLVALFRLGDGIRYYSVTGSVPTPTAATYRLEVPGLVAQPARRYDVTLEKQAKVGIKGRSRTKKAWSALSNSSLLPGAGPAVEQAPDQRPGTVTRRRR
jgi:hypothetical protein